MKKEKGFFLFLINACMEIGWIYAWANYLTYAFLHRFFPLPEGIATFAIAAALTYLTTGKGWRIANVLGIQIFGFLLTGLRIVYAFEYPSHPFLSSGWIIGFINAPRTSLAWITLLFLFFWLFFFWIKGMNLARKPLTYFTICSRFDVGLSAFFLLFLTKLVVSVKGGVDTGESMSVYLALAFFVFGMLAIGLARNQSGERKDFLPRFHGIGMVLSFAVLTVLAGTGLVLFFWPYLNMAAEVTYAGVKTVAAPFGSIFVAVLRFLYLGGANRPAEHDAGDQGGLPDLSVSGGQQPWWGELLERVLSWGLFGLVGLTLLALIVMGLFYFMRWLLSRTGQQERKSGIPFIPEWISRIRMVLVRLARKAIGFFKGYATGTQLFGAVLVWGRRSGLRHFLSETPLEYGTRLKAGFPALMNEIDLIIGAFSQEVYGEIAPDRRQIAGARSAMRRLQNPRFWPVRIKNWLVGSADSKLEEDRKRGEIRQTSEV